MGILWFDGFDHYVTSGAWSTAAAGAYTTAGGAIGSMPDLGTSGVDRGIVSTFQFAAAAASIRKNIGNQTAGDSIRMGFHFHLAGFADSNPGLCSFRSSTNNLFQVHVVSSGGIQIRSGNAIGTLLAESAPGIVSTGTAYHLEFGVGIDSTDGWVEVRLNGQTVAQASGINTAGTTISEVGLRTSASAASSSVSWFYDNLYVHNVSDLSQADNWLGERLIFTLMPNADGSDTDWVPSTGSNAWSILDNVPVTTAYIEATTVGDTTSVLFPDMPSSDLSVNAVRVEVSASKTGTSDVNVAFGPGTARSAGFPQTQDTYIRFSEIWETNPDTGLPWDPSEINSIEVAVERTL